MKQYTLFDDDFEVIVPPRKLKAPKGEAEAPVKEEPKLLFMSMGSGSSGNCCYLGTRDEGVLIDAGIEGKDVEEMMTRNGLSMEAVKGILVTHDHTDHVKYLYNIVRYHRHIGIYCTLKCLEGLLRRHGISRRIKEYHRPIFKEHPFEIAGMQATAFEVMHDGTDNVGYHFVTPRGEFAIATDLGCISDRVRFYLSRVPFMVLEANYDSVMLRDGRYAEYLKARIRATNGHMDNVETGAFIKEIFTPKLRNVFLCHLSQDNNKPQIAVEAVRHALEEAGVHDFGNGLPSLTDPLNPVHVVALPRYGASPLYVLKQSDPE